MANLTDYFAKRDADMPKEKFQMGDRVFGFWNKIPVAGSVLREVNREVMIQADLPVKSKTGYHTILTLNQKDVKLLNIEI
jgi:hypothetical protein